MSLLISINEKISTCAKRASHFASEEEKRRRMERGTQLKREEGREGGEGRRSAFDVKTCT